MNRKTILLTTFSLLFLIGCGGERANDPIGASTESLSLTKQQIVDQVVLSSVDGFASQATQFSNEADRFCNVPDRTKLATLQQEWKSLSQQWYKLALYNFGPVNDDLIFPKINFIDSLRQRGTDYTSVVRTETDTDLASTAVLNEAFFNAKNFNKVGLLALEILIFETANSAHSTLGQDIVREYTSTPRKCDYLKGMSRLNLRTADYIKTGWQSYKALFLQDELADGKTPLATLLTSIQEHLDYLAKRDVATVGAQVADYSFENIKASIDEVNTLLNGTANTTVSYLEIMAASNNQSSVDLVKANIAHVLTAIENKDAALLKADLGKLDGNFKREIPEGLNVDLGINFTDGD